PLVHTHYFMSFTWAPLSIHTPLSPRHANLFFMCTAPRAIYTLSLHDALPILVAFRHRGVGRIGRRQRRLRFDRHERIEAGLPLGDRKSTRLNSSHGSISYAVFCLKKKTIYALEKHVRPCTAKNETQATYARLS